MRTQWIPFILFAVWCCGALAVLAHYCSSAWRLARLLRKSETIKDGRAYELLLSIDGSSRIKLAFSPSSMEPGVVGIFRPTLLLPRGIVDRLNDSELEAIVAHEVASIKVTDTCGNEHSPGPGMLLAFFQGPSFRPGESYSTCSKKSLPEPTPPSEEEQKKIFESIMKGVPPQFSKGRPGTISVQANGDNFELNAPGASMGSFATQLTNFVNRRIIDRTAIDGLYDITLRFASDPQMGGITDQAFGALRQIRPPANPAASPTGPAIFTALEEQLGLKLEPNKAQLEYFVIDSIEKPSEN
jgi:uncharacterized protein (TIGR03435 family)